MPRIDLAQFRRGTDAAWVLANPVLDDGEPGLAVDTMVLKVGNGVDAWNVLPAVATDPAVIAAAIAAHNVSAGAHAALFDAARPPLVTFELAPTGTVLVDEDWAQGGTFATGGRIGQEGWALTLAGTGTATAVAAGGAAGSMQLSTVALNDAGNVNMGVNSLELAPLFRLWQRSRFSTALNDASDARTVRTGLHSDATGNTEPQNGCYWRYAQADGPNWQAVVANAGARTVVNTGVPPVLNVFQNREIICDGAGTVRFYIDGVLVATINTNLPAAGNRFGPSTSMVRDLFTAGGRNYQEDRYLLWWDIARGPLAGWP